MPEEAANPEAGALTEEAITSRIAESLMEPDEANQEPDPATAEANPEEPQTEVDEAEEAKAEEAEPTEQSEAEAAEEAEPLPDTLEGFAEALNMEGDEFARHLHVPVKINGEVKSVSIADMTKGYQLEGDYRLKTAALADDRREHVKFVEEHQNRAAASLTRLNELTTALETELYTDPVDLDRLLAEEGSEAYLRAKAVQEKRETAIIQSRGEQAKAQQEMTVVQQAKVSAFRKEQQELLKDAVPDLRDDKKLTEFEKNLRGYMGEVGWTDPEIAQFLTLYDHKQVIALRDAIRWRAMEKQKKVKPTKILPKVVKPGSVRSRMSRKAEGTQTALNRLRGSRSKKAQEAAAIDFVKELL
jgi:hypothetical protein